MDVFEAMRNRVSLAQLKPDPVPRELIEKMLEVAVWAPNHKRAEPWRFWVFEGEARQKLADALVENYRRDHPDATVEEIDGPGHKSANRVLAAPLTLVVTADNGNNRVEELENYAAASIATEHILLAAHALGLGAYWRTGDAAYTAPNNAVLELLGLANDTRIVAFLLIGYPAVTEKARTRTPWPEKTTWFA